MAVTAATKKLIILPNWCKGCGICVAFCPNGALILDNGKAALAHAEKCTGCGLCEMRCPDYAVYLEKEDGCER